MQTYTQSIVPSALLLLPFFLYMYDSQCTGSVRSLASPYSCSVPPRCPTSHTMLKAYKTCYNSPSHNSPLPLEDQLTTLERKLALAQTRLNSTRIKNNQLIEKVQETREQATSLKAVISNLSVQVHNIKDLVATERFSTLQEQIAVRDGIDQLRQMKNQYRCSGLKSNAANQALQWYLLSKRQTTVAATASQSFSEERGERGLRIAVLRALVGKWKQSIRDTSREVSSRRTHTAALAAQADRLQSHFNTTSLLEAVREAKQCFTNSDHLEKEVWEVQVHREELKTTLKHLKSASQAWVAIKNGEVEQLQTRKRELTAQVNDLDKKKPRCKFAQMKLDRAFREVLDKVKKLKLLEMLSEKGLKSRTSKELRTEELETADKATLLRLFRVLEDKIMQVVEKHERCQTTPKNRSAGFSASTKHVISPSMCEDLKSHHWDSVPGSANYRSRRLLATSCLHRRDKPN